MYYDPLKPQVCLGHFVLDSCSTRTTTTNLIKTEKRLFRTLSI